jgi:hypothetical protein
MAKNIKFHPRDPVPRKVKPERLEQHGKLVEFSKQNSAAKSKTEDITERVEVISSTALCFGCF